MAKAAKVPMERMNPRSIDDLKPAPYNPRRIGPEEKVALARSLTTFGDISGLVWNRTTGNLVAGHQRLTALKDRYGDKLILPPPYFDRLLTPDGLSFPIRIVEWDLDTEKAANIAANAETLTGVFTGDLAGLLDDIESVNPALFDGLGFGLLKGEELDLSDPDGPGSPEEGGPPAMELQPFEHYDYVLVLARTTQDWEALMDVLQLPRANASPIAGKKKIGLARAMDAAVLLKKLRR